MNELISRMTGCLTAQRDIYKQMISKSELKKEAIMSNSTDALDEIVKEEQTMLTQLQELERVRKTLLDGIAKELGLPAEGLTISDVMGVCPPSLIENLRQIQKELTTQLQAQMNINEVNRKLLESRLEYISFMTDTMSADYTNAYNPAGGDSKKRDQGSRIIDLGI